MIVVTKTEDRYKPRTMLRNAKAWFITLADRAANWTPWVEKAEESELSMEDLENGGKLNPWQRKKRVRKARFATYAQLKSQKGAPKMAGEVIQSIIGPLDADLSQLKKLIGEDAFARFLLEKAEKHDDCVAWIQADPARFESLDAAVLGNTPFKAVFGTLLAAEKADEETLIPFDSKWSRPYMEPPVGMTPFDEALGESIHELKEKICTLVSLSKPIPETRQLIMDEVADWTTWLGEALTNVETATKIDDKPKPKITDRLKSLLWGPSDNNTRPAATKGEDKMTPEEIKALIAEGLQDAAEKAADTALNKMLERAEADRAAKADTEAAKAKAEEEKARAEKMDAAIEFIGKLQAEKEEAAKTDADRVASLEEERKATQAKVDELAAKIDALQRTPGGRTPAEDVKPTVSGEARKFDPADPYAAFSDMFNPSVANA